MFVCVFVSVALVIQHATRLRRNVLSMASLVVPYFSTSSYKRHDFREKLSNVKVCFDFISEITLMYIGLRVK